MGELYDIYNTTVEALEIAIDSYATRDFEKAKTIIEVERKIDTYQKLIEINT